MATPELSSSITPENLDPIHDLRYPVRLASGPNGRVYVADPVVGSIFILDAKQEPVAEIQGLEGLLGIAVDESGTIFVGNNYDKGVDVFDSQGTKLRTIGRGEISMPNDLALDRAGNLYVADSTANVVRVFNNEGRVAKALTGPGEGFSFPASVAIAYSKPLNGPEVGELFVAEQGNGRIHVFDLSGNLLRSFGERASAFEPAKPGQFVRLQSLDVDPSGNVHAVDSFLDTVQVFESTSGAYLGSYGHFGSNEGELRLPLDLLLNARGEAVIANAENHRIEVLKPVLVAPAEGGAP
jgi:DNA-binding beta-propeller fold protein YncE